MHIIDGAYIRFAKVQLKLMKKKKGIFLPIFVTLTLKSMERYASMH